MTDMPTLRHIKPNRVEKKKRLAQDSNQKLLAPQHNADVTSQLGELLGSSSYEFYIGISFLLALTYKSLQMNLFLLKASFNLRSF